MYFGTDLVIRACVFPVALLSIVATHMEPSELCNVQPKTIENLQSQ